MPFVILDRLYKAGSTRYATHRLVLNHAACMSVMNNETSYAIVSTICDLCHLKDHILLSRQPSIIVDICFINSSKRNSWFHREICNFHRDICNFYCEIKDFYRGITAKSLILAAKLSSYVCRGTAKFTAINFCLCLKLKQWSRVLCRYW